MLISVITVTYNALPALKKTLQSIFERIYDAMNKGVRMASGEYCIFMNAADTFATPQVLADVIEHGLNADVVYGDILKQGIVKVAQEPHNSHKMYYCHQAVFTRTSCLREFPFDLHHPMSADFKQSKQ